VLRVPSLPELPRGARVKLSLDGIDLLEAEVRPRYLELAPLPASALASEMAANSGSDAALLDDEGEQAAE
jgi:hypothetical protein